MNAFDCTLTDVIKSLKRRLKQVSLLTRFFGGEDEDDEELVEEHVTKVTKSA